METKRISIIIPIHNSEQYLCNCIDSVLCQVEPNDEIILVNDGSTDNSLVICNHYKEEYPQIIQIINKETQSGPSDSRNIGKSDARGEYICFIDSDDWFSPSTLNDMYEYATTHECEIVQTGFYYAYEDYLLYNKKLKNKYPYPQTISREKAMEHLVKDGLFTNFIWGKIYKAELVKKYDFPIDVNMGEDMFWQHLVLHESNRVGMIPAAKYYYRQNSQSLSNVFSERHVTLLKAFDNRLTFIKKYYPNLVPDMLYVYWKQTYQSRIIAKRLGTDNCKNIFDTYWMMFNEKYGSELKSSVKRLDYMLYSQSETAFKCYTFINRVIGHFVSDFKKIPVKK